jgi:hypothetical protein
MQTAAECHQYARDSVRWAARASTEEQRRGFLEIERAWREAALLIETCWTLFAYANDRE